MKIDHTRLAADYCEEVREALTAAQLAAVNLRNSAETDPEIDHVHDFIDANDCMDAALRRQNETLMTYSENVATTMHRARLHNFQLRRVLVACEFSGRVRDAIAANGHDAISCDLLPTETPGKHYVGDVRDILGDGFTDMVSHPPCTYLCGSSAKHHRNNPRRDRLAAEALEFVRDLMAAPVERQALENPVGKISTLIRKPDQYIQPWQFGDDASKKTGLWLDGLPLLKSNPADHVAPRIIEYRGKQVKRWANQSPCGADKTGPGPDRWRIRSLTFPGIAQAIAAQWFNPLTI